MRIKAFTDIYCTNPVPLAEITLQCTCKELNELMQELQGSLKQQVKIVALHKDRKGIVK